MADQRIERAEHLATLNRHEDVLAILSDPGLNHSAEAARLRVFALLNLDRIMEAHNEADRLIGLAPHSPLSFLARSYSWEGRDRPWEALADARRAVEFAPASPLIRSRLATTLARLGQLDEAHEHVGWVLSQEPDEPDHWVLLGRVYYHLNRFDDAEGALLEALRLDPQSSDAKVMLAGVHAEVKGGRHRSVEALVDVLRDNPTQHSVRQLLLRIAFPGRMPGEMLVVVAAIALVLGPFVAIPVALGYAALVTHRYRQVSPEIRMLLRSNPSDRRRFMLEVIALLVVVAASLAGVAYLLWR